MVLMDSQVVARIGWRALPLAIVINDQVACKTHQPVREIAKRRIVLIQRAIDSNEDFLRKVFGAAMTRGKPISQIVDPARVLAHDLRPGLLVAFHTTLNQFSIG